MKNTLSILYWLCVAVVGVLLLSFTSFVTPNWIIISSIFFLGYIVCVFNSIKNAGYIKQTLALSKDNNRNLVYDYLRFIAVLLVISIHVLNMDLAAAESLRGEPIFNVMNYIRCWVGNCNTFFVMISGALLLVDKDETVFTFYKKRLLRIAIPLVIYYIWYLWQYEQLGQLSILEIAYKILSADVYTDHVPHFWLIYEIVAIYVVVPFLRIMLKNMSYKMLTQMVAILFVLSIFMTLIPNQVGTTIPLAGLCTVAIIGYWYTRDESRKLDTWMILVGIIASVVEYTQVDSSVNYQESMTGLTHFWILTVLGVFAIIFKLSKHLKSFYLLRITCKYSYGIILIHMWVLYFVVRKYLTISSVMYKGVGFILMDIATLLGSIFAAYIIDNLIVKIINPRS